MRNQLSLFIGVALCVAAVVTGAAEEVSVESFYTRPALFSLRPASDFVVPQSVDRFGPVGIGIELHPPAFIMKVKNVEEGSPAAATGQLKAGQIIETINGQKLHDIDPRIQLGGMITEAEAKDGKVMLAVRDDESAPLQQVTVTIPVLGAYGKTWPLNCAKSDKIIRNLADRLAQDSVSGISLDGTKILFLLSTGEEKDLEVVRGWVKTIVEKNKDYGAKRLVYAWFIGWGGPPLAEYYLRTGDESVLPLLKKIAAAAKPIQYHDGWGGRGLAGHHMGLAGTSTLTFLLLARQCGVEVDEGMLQSALTHYYRFAGKGTNPYMDAHPEGSFTDNGRNGKLAFAMAAAAALIPEGENSVYARARDIAAISSFYSSTYMLHGHTGGGIGEVWRSAAMGLMVDKKPSQYRDFMEQRTWFYDLSRRYDGSFGILGGESYDKESWGLALGLTYTAPRKKLCIFGAPRSTYAHYYKIPARPWGTAADDTFLAQEAAADKDGKVQNLDDERIATDTGLSLNRMVSDPAITDEELLKLIRHPQHLFRATAAGVIYKTKRFHLIPALLKDKDARVRYAGVSVMKLPTVSSRPEKCDPGFPSDAVTKEILDQLFVMLNDPDESWFVVDQVMQVLALRSADELAPHADRLITFLGSDEPWLRHAALKALVPLAVDKRTYQKVLPGMEREVPNFVRGPEALKDYADRLKDADPELQKAGRETLGRIYLNYPGKNATPRGGLHPSSGAWYLDTVAGALAAIPGGLDSLYEVSRKRFPDNALSHRSDFLPSVGSGLLSEDLNKAIAAVVESDLIPEFVAQNRSQLLSEAAWNKPTRNSPYAVGVLGGCGMRQGLSDLYRQAGITDYDWHTFGPERGEVKWDYYSFDPKEEQLWEAPESRYRQVTLPDGMEKWYTPGFDAQKAGWKSGYAPFAAVDGKFPEPVGSCNMSICGCREAPKTFWEKEVLLMRGTFDLPPLDRTKRYRLLIGGRSHVGNGDGLAIYLNGERVHEQTAGTGRREGAQPCGFFIDKEMAKAFGNGGNVEIAVKAFMGKHPRSQEKRGFITIFFEEMNVPPLKEIMGASAKARPMLSSEWQALQYPDVEPDDPDEGKFRYDGTFVSTPKLLGTWTLIHQVPTIDAFTTERKMTPGKAPFKTLTFKDQGETDLPLWIWSGNTLMDLENNQALKMTVKVIDGTDYLFVETGGFNAKLGSDWASPLYVLKRK